MANWCSNFFSYDGHDKVKVDRLFKRLAKKEKLTQMGQTLKWFKDDRYLFEIQAEEGYVSFETKWSPSIDTIKNIFQRYNVHGRLEYEECGMGIYGRFIKKQDGNIFGYDLDLEIINRIDYDDDENVTFNGEPCESHAELIDFLLDAKQSSLGL